MSDLIVIHENFAAHAEATVSCAQASASFPASYLVDWDAARQMRLSGAAWTIVVTLPYAREIDFIALLHTSHLGSTEITVQGRALASDSLSALGTIEMGSAKNGHLLLGGATMLSEVQLSVAGGGGGGGGAVDPHEVVLGAEPQYGRIGQLYLGESVTLGDNYNRGYGDSLAVPTLASEAQGGSRFIYQLGEPRRSLSVAWEVDAALRAQLRALFEDTRGNMYPFCLIDHDGDLLFVRGPASLDWQHVFLTDGRQSLALVEEPMPLDAEASS